MGILCAVVLGCAESTGFGWAIAAENRTDVSLHFTIVRTDGVMFDLVSVAAPGTKVDLIHAGMLDPAARYVVDTCTVGPLIAYGPDGVEVARQEPPVCASDHTVWIIGPFGSSAPSAQSLSSP